MAKREQEQCRYYAESLQEIKERIAELQERGAVQTARALENGHLVYYTTKVRACEETPRQVTLFEPEPAPDGHVEADDDERNGDIGDWGDSI
jgi:hypothetical protein